MSRMAVDGKTQRNGLKLGLIWVICSSSCFLLSESILVPITYVTTAVSKGGVCLDGSPPAYHWDKGSGSGLNNWLLHVQGGAWCNDVTTCLARSNTSLGSSKYMPTNYNFSGILSNQKEENPDFYNWNRVEILYCDGSSFTGDVESVDPVTKLYYRGERAWSAIMDDLLENGMNNSQSVLLAGCSAGGLTTILHCDCFRSLFPTSTTVKCLSDAGFFINVKDVSGASLIEQFFSQVVATHGSEKNLPASCTSNYNSSLCFFPQYAAQGMETPLFLLNAAYDSWQVQNILAPPVADPLGKWNSCKGNITTCSSSELQTLQDFRGEFLSALSMLGNSTTRGMFINSCYCHCQTTLQETWLRDDSPVLDATQIWKAVGDWYFERDNFQKIDCAYPCDQSCHNNL